MANVSDPDIARQEITQVREDLESMDVKLALSNIMAAETRLLLQAKQIPAAFHRIADAKIYIEDTGERYYESEILRLEGDVFKANDQRDHAEISYRRALATAEHQGARWWKLRALTSLTELRTDDLSLEIAFREIVNDFEHLDLVAVKHAKHALLESELREQATVDSQ